MTTIDLTKLPSPTVIEQLDYESILEEMRQQLNGLQPTLLTTAITPVIKSAELFTAENGEKYFKVPAGEDVGLMYLELDSDPTVKQLQVAAYREMLLRRRINDSALATMLAFATGPDLEHEAARFGVYRLLITPADTEAVPPVEAAYESDTSLRRRAQLAMEGFSTAGPAGAYEFHALSASALVKAVNIDAPTFTRLSLTTEQEDALPAGAIVLAINDDAGLTDPMPGDVAVTVLSTEGDGTADQPLLDAVDDGVSAKDVRPLTDRPRVRSAEIVNYSIAAELIMFPGPDSNVALAAAITAVETYANDSKDIGVGPTLSGIYAALKQPGVYDVVLSSPVETPSIGPYQSAYCTEINVIIGGTYE